jgi:predicted outer membrane protein
MKNFIVVITEAGKVIDANTASTKKEITELLGLSRIEKLNKEADQRLDRIMKSQKIGDTDTFDFQYHEAHITRKKDTPYFEPKKGKLVTALAIISADYYECYALLTFTQEDIAAIKQAIHTAKNTKTKNFANYIPIFGGEVKVFQGENWEYAEAEAERVGEICTIPLEEEVPNNIKLAPDIVEHQIIECYSDGDIIINAVTYAGDEIELKVSSKAFNLIF